LPRRPFTSRELVVVAAREGLQGDEARVVLEQDADAAGGIDLRLVGPSHYAFPAEAGWIKPISKCTPPRLEHAVE
jgi:hypothetical protein